MIGWLRVGTHLGNASEELRCSPDSKGHTDDHVAAPIVSETKNKIASFVPVLSEDLRLMNSSSLETHQDVYLPEIIVRSSAHLDIDEREQERGRGE